MSRAPTPHSCSIRPRSSCHVPRISAATSASPGPGASAAQPGAVVSVDVSSDGQLAATGGEDATVRLWNLRLHQELDRLEGHSMPVNAVTLAPQGDILFSASDDQSIRMWDVYH